MTTAPKSITSKQHPIVPGTSIGHVNLKVSDLDRAIEFYCGVLGFDVMQRYGDPRLGLLRVEWALETIDASRR
jgi:catechol 2,3-dioxygenase